MYKKITKSMEASMQVGSWFALGYRTFDDYYKLSGWKKLNNNLKLYGEWIKNSYKSIVKNSNRTIKIKGVKI